MGEKLEKMMLPFKVQQLLDTIIEKKKLGVEDAMQYLYSSDLYRQMSAADSYLWQLSTPNLYDLLKREKHLKKQNQNCSTQLLLFLSFCIEHYKAYKQMSAEEVLFLCNKYKVINYLEKVFDTLHTQSRDYIMNEIDNYITNSKPQQ